MLGSGAGLNRAHSVYSKKRKKNAEIIVSYSCFRTTPSLEYVYAVCPGHSTSLRTQAMRRCLKKRPRNLHMQTSKAPSSDLSPSWPLLTVHLPIPWHVTHLRLRLVIERASRYLRLGVNALLVTTRLTPTNRYAHDIRERRRSRGAQEHQAETRRICVARRALFEGRQLCHERGRVPDPHHKLFFVAASADSLPHEGQGGGGEHAPRRSWDQAARVARARARSERPRS